MKIDIQKTPENDIFRDRKRWVIWFTLSLTTATAGIAMGVILAYSPKAGPEVLQDWALGLLVAASLVATWSGNRLQAYKKLYPPHKEKLAEWRQLYPIVEKYCTEVDGIGRRLIKAEFEAFQEYAEHHSEVPFT